MCWWSDFSVNNTFQSLQHTVGKLVDDKGIVPLRFHVITGTKIFYFRWRRFKGVSHISAIHVHIFKPVVNTIPVGGLIESPRGVEGKFSGSQHYVGVVGVLEVPVGGVGEVELLTPSPVPSATQRPSQCVAEADGHDGVEERIDCGV